MLNVLTLLISTTFFIALANLAAAETDLQFYGIAYDLDSEKVLYSEHHHYVSPTLHKVIYKEADDVVFATKTVDYSKGLFDPEITFNNTRIGEFIRTEKSNNSILLTYQENTKSSAEKHSIKATPSLIIDAGFDHYITHYWNTLTKGKELTIDYLIPSMGDYYELTVKKIDCENQDNYCFSISASSFFIRIFANELELTYAKYEQSNKPNDYRLASFKGRTNIADNEGNYLDAIIRYNY